MSGRISTETLRAQWKDAHSPKTGRVKKKMDVEQHGTNRNRMVNAGGTFFLHIHGHIRAQRHAHAGGWGGGVWMGLINSVQRKRDSQRARYRYLHKGLHLVSLRWRWWGEGWPVNMKRYTHYLSVWGWQHTGIMRYTHYHSGAKWTDAMGTVGESPWGSDWEWGLGPGDRRLLTTAATHPAITSICFCA